MTMGEDYVSKTLCLENTVISPSARNYEYVAYTKIPLGETTALI
jgi:hypothetical protein